MRNARRWRGYAVFLLIALAASACGTRLPDSAFVNAGAGGTGTAATNRGATGTGGGTASGAATGAGTGATGGAGGGTASGAAAGPGGGAGGGGADGPNQASDVGVTADEIVIGNISAIDGILGNAFAPPLRGLQAFV